MIFWVCLSILKSGPCYNFGTSWSFLCVSLNVFCKYVVSFKKLFSFCIVSEKAFKSLVGKQTLVRPEPRHSTGIARDYCCNIGPWAEQWLGTKTKSGYSHYVYMHRLLRLRSLFDYLVISPENCSERSCLDFHGWAENWMTADTAVICSGFEKKQVFTLKFCSSV